MSHLLITGGAGFIGSHVCTLLLNSDYRITVFDNFTNSSPSSLAKIAELTTKSINFIKGDIRDFQDLDNIFKQNAREDPIIGVLHFAGLKAVGESVIKPLRYWDTNVSGTRTLIKAMDENNCKTLVFSSSATVYGFPKSNPVSESAEIAPLNPYGNSKAAVEVMLCDLAASAPDEWKIACLRYFNPVGAHESGLIGENPNGIPNNLFPYISQVAIGKINSLSIFGNDWNTTDGTCIRDYIHIMDLALGHKVTLEALLEDDPQFLTLNLGSGKGSSVLEVLQTYEIVCGKKIPFRYAPRRSGDAAITVADPSLAFKKLGWRTTKTLKDMCVDSWNWQSKYPDGYGENGF